MLIKQLLDYLTRELALDKQYTTLTNANNMDRNHLSGDEKEKSDGLTESNIDGNHLILIGNTWQHKRNEPLYKLNASNYKNIH